jgi:hypothetical protein
MRTHRAPGSATSLLMLFVFGTDLNIGPGCATD